MKFSIKDFFSICYQICRKPRIWSHLLKKTLMENFIFLVQCNIKKCSRIWPMSFRIWTENEDMCATVYRDYFLWNSHFLCIQLFYMSTFGESN